MTPATTITDWITQRHRARNRDSMSTPTLPPAEWQYPTCGACYEATEPSDDGYVCEPCGLWFSGQDLAAAYIDDTAEQCGHPCNNRWHLPGVIKPGWTHICTPCQLPTGHTSDHWTNCTPEEIS